MIKNLVSYITNNYPIKDDEIISIYDYGSTVYGTRSELSDFDFIVVTSKKLNINDSIKTKDFDVTIYHKDEFETKVNDHEISVLECLWLDENFIHRESWKPDFKLNLQQLRHSFAAKASNSFVKAKKKLMYNEEYIGKKSLWHSFRIIIFGIQIAEFGEIVNYSAANYLYDAIVKNNSKDPEYYKEKFLKPHNALMTEFRKLAPKIGEKI